MNDPTIARMYNYPPFRRAFWRALEEIVRGPFQKDRLYPILDARYAALQASGISAGSPATIKSYVEQRRNYILQQLGTVSAPFALAGTNQITTSNQLLTISGTAPVSVKTITVNGAAWPVTWTSVTSWKIQWPLVGGTNQLLLEGLGREGTVVSNASRTVQVVYTGATQAPEDWIVINEILYSPAVPEASFVEIYNTSPVFSFDLSGWRLSGLDFVFPLGSVLTNGQFAVITKNRTALQLQYGAGISILGEFNGQLASGGETLALVKPGAGSGQDQVIDRVSYGVQPPWPAEANGTGASLQLRDATQDNSRVSNWGVDMANWRFASVTGIANSSRLIFYLSSAGDVYLDDISLVAGSVPEVGIEPNPERRFRVGVPHQQRWAVDCFGQPEQLRGHHRPVPRGRRQFARHRHQPGRGNRHGDLAGRAAHRNQHDLHVELLVSALDQRGESHPAPDAWQRDHEHGGYSPQPGHPGRSQQCG